MSMEDIERDLEKLKYQVKMLSYTIDPERHPIESMVLEMDWDGGQLSKAHDIFEVYDKKLDAEEDVNWTEFEMALRNEFGIDYQTVKSIILAFFINHQWTDVCKGYAMSFEPTTPVEFHRITRGDENS